MISFVYFDVGGVIVDDFSGNDKWKDLKKELGVIPSNNTTFDALWSQYEPELCTSRDVDTLLPILTKELRLNLPKDYSLLNGFVSRFYANSRIWPIIDKLSNKVAIGLLTNMYPRMFAAITQKGILPSIVWDVVVDSSIELLQKPDRKLFELAQKKAHTPNKEILFIDNSPEHIMGARTFGWQTFLYNSSDHEAAIQELDHFLSNQQFRN